MKKSRIIGIVIIILLFIVIGGYIFYQKMVEEGRKYEVIKIEEPQYFFTRKARKIWCYKYSRRNCFRAKL